MPNTLRHRASFVAAAFFTFLGSPLFAAPGDLVRTVRTKISAGDLFTGEAAVSEYRREHGVDAEYLGAVGWLARGAALLGKADKAWAYVAEVRKEIPEEKADLTVALGAAIETEGRLRAGRDGRGAALKFFETEYARAKDTELRCRIRKNVNLLSLEGQPAPEMNVSIPKGRPAVLFFWAHWCGDCKAQAPALGRVLEKYRAKGLAVIAPTRLFGTGAENKPATPAEEKAWIEKAWKESYGMLDGVPTPIDTETMVRWGVSSNPTLALVDRKGLVRLYTPTRLSEEELSRRIEELLAE
ncbi:MAG: TlpA disulfide reductase family protein [Acidobacteriota bacterium]